MDSSTIWQQPPPSLELADAEIHVWQAELDQSEQVLEQMWGVLSVDEQRRVQRFVKEQHSNRALASAAILRHILSCYIGVAPTEISLDRAKGGKPYLLDAGLQHDLRFNLSHSENRLLCAVALSREVGVDIEHHNPSVHFEEIAKRFFAKSEYEFLQSIPSQEHACRFYQIWTCKEAYVKLIGEGLAHNLKNFTVVSADVANNKFKRIFNREGLCQGVLLRLVNVGDKYTAALAAAGIVSKVLYWGWEQSPSLFQ